jgi:hypothetical protein
MAASQGRRVLFCAPNPTLRVWRLADRTRAARDGTTPMPAEDRLVGVHACGVGNMTENSVPSLIGQACAAHTLNSVPPRCRALSQLPRLHLEAFQVYKHRCSARTTSAPTRTRNPLLSRTLAKATANPLHLTLPTTPPPNGHRILPHVCADLADGVSCHPIFPTNDLERRPTPKSLRV